MAIVMGKEKAIASGILMEESFLIYILMEELIIWDTETQRL